MARYKAHTMLGTGMLFVDFDILYDINPVRIYDVEVLQIDSDSQTRIPKEWLVARGYYEPLRRKILKFVIECIDYEERIQYEYDAQI